MYDENQLVSITWSNKSRKYYEEKEYIFTEYGDVFYVKAKDLPRYSHKEVKVICDFCGKEYYVSFQSLGIRTNKSKIACNSCKTQKQHEGSFEQRKHYQFEKLKKFCLENGYELITDESEYTTVLMPITYKCPKHGVQTSTLDNMVHGHGCIKCSYEKRGEQMKHSAEYIQSVIEEYNGNTILNVDEYVDANTHNLKIKCGICGTIYETSFSDYTNNKQIRCGICSQRESNNEVRIRHFLESHNIEFIQEKRFPDCKDICTLPFDFYLPDYNLCIEYDGFHHYGVRYTEKQLLKTQEHDKIKNQYCKDCGIDLLRIPFWEQSNIEDILTKRLNL